ncbi:recombinase family protein [Loktanella sp. DJP18]|uniref:recombinase family protein n=1 Tax=Loktanella sp. DJP18 TaxID=3409788 RepID=UPI003BB5AC64
MTQHAHHAPRRVAIYARYSTDMQNPKSVEDQFRLAERYAAREGWVVVERFSDRAISGTASHDRADFLRLMDALVAKDRTFDIVLAESLDRVSRDAEHLARFSKLAIHARVEIHTVDRGKADALAVNLSSLLSGMFLEKLSATVHRGIEGNVSRGLSGGGRIYGYKPGTDQRGAPLKGQLAIDEIEAAVVRSIFRDYAAGISPIKIATRLNGEGIASPSVGSERESSGHWKQNTINGNRGRGTGIINNELYIGRRIWNRLRYSKDPHTEKRTSTLNPESQWQTVEVPDLRIIDQELWDAVKARQAALAKRKSTLESTDRNHLSTGQALRRRKYLLSGLLQCGQCGGNMTVAGAAKYKTYYCANAKEKGPSVCAGFRGLRESVALPLVLDGLRSELMKPQAYAAFRESFHKRLEASQGASVDALQLHDARVRKLETTQRNLVRAVEEGKFAAAIIDRLNAVDAELKDLRGKRDEIVPSTVELPENLPELYLAMISDLASSLSDEAVAGRAADELHEIIDRVVVHWDGAAYGHRLEMSGNVLEMLRKSAPRELEAVSGVILGEVGCGSRI